MKNGLLVLFGLISAQTLLAEPLLTFQDEVCGIQFQYPNKHMLDRDTSSKDCTRDTFAFLPRVKAANGPKIDPFFRVICENNRRPISSFEKAVREKARGEYGGEYDGPNGRYIPPDVVLEPLKIGGHLAFHVRSKYKHEKFFVDMPLKQPSGNCIRYIEFDSADDTSVAILKSLRFGPFPALQEPQRIDQKKRLEEAKQIRLSRRQEEQANYEKEKAAYEKNFALSDPIKEKVLASQVAVDISDLPPDIRRHVGPQCFLKEDIHAGRDMLIAIFQPDKKTWLAAAVPHRYVCDAIRTDVIEKAPDKIKLQIICEIDADAKEGTLDFIRTSDGHWKFQQ